MVVLEQGLLGFVAEVFFGGAWGCEGGLCGFEEEGGLLDLPQRGDQHLAILLIEIHDVHPQPVRQHPPDPSKKARPFLAPSKANANFTAADPSPALLNPAAHRVQNKGPSTIRREAGQAGD